MRCLLWMLLLAAPLAAQDVLVVAPKEFQPALAAWQEHRVAQGHRIVVAEPGVDVKAVHGASGGKLRFVLLLGDVKRIPCAYRAGERIKIWEKDPRIANDNALADLDGDDLPDLAVGRLPADTVEEAQGMLDRVVAYERSTDFSSWRRRINVIAGVGGFGKMADWALEQVATRFLTQNVPMEIDLNVTYANASSPFCPPPERLRATVLDRFNEGALIVTYLGHGSRLSLDRMRFQGRRYDIFTEDDIFLLDARRGAPIAFFVACSTGHIDGAPDCMGEFALKQARGPVAVIASSRVSMPYGNGVLAKEVLDAVLTQRLPTIGEALQQAKRRMMKPLADDPGRQFIETLATPYEWRAEKRAEERLEHVFLYNLLGDPTMRIPLPAVASLECAASVAAGTALVVRGKSPWDGAVRVELVSPRTSALPGRKGDDTAAFQAAYDAANRRVVAAVDGSVADGAFRVELGVPPGQRAGKYFVRVYVHGTEGAAMGTRPIVIEEKPQ